MATYRTLVGDVLEEIYWLHYGRQAARRKPSKPSSPLILASSARGCACPADSRSNAVTFPNPAATSSECACWIVPRTPGYRLRADRSDITDAFHQRPLRLVATDEAEPDADVFELCLDDCDSASALPLKLVMLDVAFGYCEHGLAVVGLYTADEIESANPRSTLMIGAKAGDLQTTFKAKKTGASVTPRSETLPSPSPPNTAWHSASRLACARSRSHTSTRPSSGEGTVQNEPSREADSCQMA